MSYDLYARMRQAATTLEQAALKAGWGESSSWSPSELRKWSDTWSAEDREQQKKDQLLNQLAARMYNSQPSVLPFCDLSGLERGYWLTQAKAVLEAFDVKPKGA